MGKTDHLVIFLLIIAIILYLSVLIMVLANHKLSNLIWIVNLLSGLGIIIYWAQNEIRITQHAIEPREVIVLCLEVVVIFVSAFSMNSKHEQNWLTIIKYMFFGIHFLCLIVLLLFMLLFKMNKLM